MGNNDYRIIVSQTVGSDKLPRVRIHIIDPGGKDGRWIELSCEDAIAHGKAVLKFGEAGLDAEPGEVNGSSVTHN